MCATVYYKDKKINSVKELVSELNLKPFQLQTSNGYKVLDLDSCLCQIDVRITLNNNGFRFFQTQMLDFKIIE